MKFLLDANVFVQAKDLFYRFEFCQGFWDWVDDAHNAGCVASIQKVLAELKKGNSNDPVRQWAESQPAGFFLPDIGDPKVVPHYAALQTWAAGSAHYHPAAKAQFASGSNADPFLIAAAKAKGATVVSFEARNDEKRRGIPVPNAALAIGVPSITIYDLLSKHATGTFTFRA